MPGRICVGVESIQTSRAQQFLIWRSDRETMLLIWLARLFQAGWQVPRLQDGQDEDGSA
jgi:hypothetical protein